MAHLPLLASASCPRDGNAWLKSRAIFLSPSASAAGFNLVHLKPVGGSSTTMTGDLAVSGPGYLALPTTRRRRCRGIVNHA